MKQCDNCDNNPELYLQILHAVFGCIGGLLASIVSS